MINNFVSDMCQILNVPVPTISFDTSVFLSKTTMAQINLKDNTLHIKPYKNPNPDLLFSITHELRHLWQFTNDENLYFSNYKTVKLCKSIEEYNLQLAEIDSNAFAGLIMIEFFHIKPLFENLSEKVKLKIQERMNVINTDFYF